MRAEGIELSRLGKFEDLIAWQKARELSREIYSLPNDGALARAFRLRDRIRYYFKPLTVFLSFIPIDHGVEEIE